ncbi:hypothetical protein [Bifidobacterium myosotis]|uniref:Uncharacterized protein n=1 Tax=Bifidobacterium myosotis TaxID=1630166 RepID=A0A5M9ZLG5_9BIFI|nr:hypothetical protein [Bifidobacterium myosotis]KAA8828153.1 hypothetical protein EMO91_06850 [Bifidobacterium myosotis]
MDPKTDTTLQGLWDADWTGDVSPWTEMGACPGCGRHMRPAARRFREDGLAAVGYYALCPNQCPLKRPDDYPGLTADAGDGDVRYTPIWTARASAPSKRVAAGRRADLAEAANAWNTWLLLHDRTTPAAPSGHVWEGAVACPACGREIIGCETFDRDRRTWVGCPDHPHVASAPVDRYDPDNRAAMRRLARDAEQWQWLLDGAECALCGARPKLEVDGTDGWWRCLCACDRDADAEGRGTAVEAIGDHRSRVAALTLAANERRRRRTANLAELDAIHTELGKDFE